MIFFQSCQILNLGYTKRETEYVNEKTEQKKWLVPSLFSKHQPPRGII